MSRERFDQAIVEDLERDLREALTIEPSADFARQVRARIEQRPHGVMPAWFGWRGALAAAAVCVLAVGVGWRATRDDAGASVRPKPDTTTAAPGSVRLKPDTTAAAPASASVRPKPDTTAKARGPNGGKKAPEILISPDGARAVAHLLALARSGAIDEESLTPVAAAPPRPTLDVAPIVVPAIPLPAVENPGGAARGGAGPQ